MKKIIVIGLIFVSLALSGQNTMKYLNVSYDNGLQYDSLEIDITSLKTNNYVNKRLGDSIVNWWQRKMIVDENSDTRVLLYEFGVKWSGAEVQNLINGDYTGSVTNKVNFFNLVFADKQLKKQQELTMRLRNELEPDIGDLVDSVCVGYSELNSVVVGILSFYSETNNTARLDNKDGKTSWIVEYYTVTKATNEEKERYY